MDFVRWRPPPRVAAAMSVGGLAVFGLSVTGYGWLFLATHDGDKPLVLQGTVGMLAAIAISVVLTALMLLLHELLHALVYRLAGCRVRLRLRLNLLVSLVEVLEPRHLSRPRFVAAALTPLVTLSALAAPLVLWAPYGGWWVVPTAANVAASLADVAGAVVAVRLPPGSRVRATVSGLTIHTPSAGKSRAGAS